MSTLDQAMNYLADRADIGTVLHHTANKAVSANTETTILSVTIPAGVWLVVSNMDLSVSASGTYNHVLDGMVVRSPATNGGGSCNCKVITKTTAGTVVVKGYIATACTMRERLWAIKLAPVS